MTVTWMNKPLFLAVILTTTLQPTAHANDLPGTGINVQPLQSAIAEDAFQTLILNKAMEKLGYNLLPTQTVDYNVAFVSVANGDATYFPAYWSPLQDKKYEKSGGDTKFSSKGQYISHAAQGYMIDKKTADKYNITNIAQLKDPELAKLFDANGDGKADLIGCDPGWGCADVVTHQLKEFGLNKTITDVKGNYTAIITDTIARYNNGDSVLYYTWTPYWVSNVLVPGKDVIWLEVPYSSLPGKRSNTDTTLSNGKNYGFEMNSMKIAANKTFVDQNPAAAKLFSIVTIDINDISAQNMMVLQGQNKPEDIEAHANGWIKAHQATFDSWISEAKKSAK